MSSSRRSHAADSVLMHPSSALVRPEPYSVRATTTSSHPQLRDLLVHTPEHGNAVTVVCYDSLCTVDCYASRPPEYTPLKFSPSVLAAGMGLIAAGGQSSELALKSATPGSEWCFQHLPSESNASATGVRTLHSGSINNGIFICPSPTSPSTPRLLVSSNDEVIKVFEVEGAPPDYRKAKRRRERVRREEGFSVVEATWAAERGETAGGLAGTARAGRTRSSAESDDDDGVEEQPSYDPGQACHLAPRSSENIRLNTAVNHCSVSPDGKWLIAVGDTNEVFLYSAPRHDNEQYELAHTFVASSDASFSTDWNSDNRSFAVASQDGFVHVFDIRSLPSCSRPASPTLRGASSSPRKVAELKTTQTGPAGAARKVKFSPGGRTIDGGLMAFTEHRNRVHIVDARNFETYQVLDVPIVASQPVYRPGDHLIPPPWSSSYLPNTPPPLRPRPQPPPRTFRSLSRPSLSRLPSASFSSLASFDAAGGGSGTCTPRDEKERDELEREMRERTERRARHEDRRLRMAAHEVRRVRNRRLAPPVGVQVGENEVSGAGSGDAARNDAMEIEEAGGVEEAEEDDFELDRMGDDDEIDDLSLTGARSYRPPRYRRGVNSDPLRHDRDQAADDVLSGVDVEVLPYEDDDFTESDTEPDNYQMVDPQQRSSHVEQGDEGLSASEDEDDDSADSSTNTTRPRRFGPWFGGRQGGEASRSTDYLATSRDRFVANPLAAVPIQSRDETTVLDIPVRRNYSGTGYTPLARESIGPIRLPAYVSRSRLGMAPGSSSNPQPSAYYSTYVPSNYPSASVSFAASALPASSIPLASLFSAPLIGGGTYQATSAFFPLDSTPGDLLGLDWDEWGERVFVATGERVWEWEVDARARRGSAAWGVL